MRLKNIALSVAVVAAATFGSFARAGSLNLLTIEPDTVTNPLTATYDSATQSFTASGSGAMAVDLDPAHDMDYLGGTFSLNATIDNNGVLQSGGTISISGVLLGPVGPTGPGVVISGKLTDFGFVSQAGGAPQLEFTFDVDSGDLLSSLYGPKGGIIINLSSPTISFASADGGFTRSGTADTFAVPVPLPQAALSGGLLMGGLGLICLWRTRKKIVM